MIAAGRLDRRITLQTATATKDAFNADVETWANLATVWAQVTPVSDGERFRGGEVAASQTHRFLIRWSSLVRDFDPRGRVLYDGRTFDVLAVKEIGRREGLEITGAARAERV